MPPSESRWSNYLTRWRNGLASIPKLNVSKTGWAYYVVQHSRKRRAVTLYLSPYVLPPSRLSPTSRQLQKRSLSESGFSLLEMLLVVALLTLLAGIAVPTWQAYQRSTQSSLMLARITSIHVFQADYRMQHGDYAKDLGDVGEIAAAIGWQPGADDPAGYSIAAGKNSEPSYQVTATHPNGDVVCLVLPQRHQCE